MDGWVICPKCLSSVLEEPGHPCIECGVPMVDTPLFPESTVDTEPAIDWEEIGLLTPAEQELLIEMGLG